MANVLGGQKFDNGDSLVSLTLTNSKGFGDQGANRGGSVYDWGYPTGTDHFATGKAPVKLGNAPGDAARMPSFCPP